MPEFEINHQTGISLRELIDFRQWTESQLFELWRLQPGDDSGYAYIKVDRVKYSAHRLAWLYVHGSMPEEQIDHVNNNRSDNRISNLRLASRSQNMMNQYVRKDSISGVKGVGWDKKMQSWRARCQVGGKRVVIGWFDSVEEAEESLRVYREQYHGEFANHGVNHDNRN
ncbi:HNH endonuclease [Enterobacter cloacae]|uniref:HNH endonuclease n=1 Tax=Enterobacter cloacae TaxID=550 RepID=UPI003F42D2C3